MNNISRIIFTCTTIALFVSATVWGRVTSDTMVGKALPAIASPVWFNGDQKLADNLTGKVVLVEFWTFGCYNCRNVEPYVKKWYDSYKGKGLVVIGVHSPEFDNERDTANVQRYISEKNIRYPVAIDNDFSIWKSFSNHYWPTMYLVDKRGIIRHIAIGEGDYQNTELKIQALLSER